MSSGIKSLRAWLDCISASGQIARVKRSRNPHPAGHVLLPAAAIGGLSVVLAAGLELLGVLVGMNAVIARMVSRGGAETFPNALPEWSVWLAATVLAFGVAIAILGTPGGLRRVLLWLSAVVLVAAWAPVLGLAAFAPDIAAPCVATIWSGICALVYASRHAMPADQPESDPAAG
jgi:hypothetical protein